MFSMHGVFQVMQNIKGLNTQMINSVTLAIPITNYVLSPSEDPPSSPL